jgi:periplasmic protein TonB
MTAATPGPSGSNLFSMFSGQGNGLYRSNRETFLFSLLGQELIMGLLVYFTSCVIQGTPGVLVRPLAANLPLIFSGRSGGGGGGMDKLPASRGNPPQASLEQLVPPTVIVPKEMHKLMVPETVIEAPDVKFPEGGQIGDPLSQFTRVLSDGSGGPRGIGTGCCDGVGPSTGPHFGPGPEGIYRPGIRGVTVPQVIYNPEPNFSDEARKSKTQGVVTLVLVVGKDGHTYNIRVGQSLGMGLDEKAIEAVKHWRFRPATLNGEAVATQVAVEVDFHLY